MGNYQSYLLLHLLFCFLLLLSWVIDFFYYFVWTAFVWLWSEELFFCFPILFYLWIICVTNLFLTELIHFNLFTNPLHFGGFRRIIQHLSDPFQILLFYFFLFQLFHLFNLPLLFLPHLTHYFLMFSQLLRMHLLY